LCSTSRKSDNSSRAIVTNWLKRSFNAVSPKSGGSPARTRSISSSMACRRRSSSCTRTSGSVSLPSPIWRSNSNSVSRRDSVPTKLRSLRLPSQDRARSVAGVRSKCGSSDPGG
jgi:hypothetical protein